MNEKESAMIMATIKTVYPSFHSKTDEQTRLAAVKLMTLILADIEYELVDIALTKYISEPHEFPPNPGQLRDLCERLQNQYIVVDNLFGVDCDEKVPLVRQYLIKKHEERKKLWLLQMSDNKQIGLLGDS